MPEWNDLAGTIGPVGAVLFWMWWSDRKDKPAAKEDPAKLLVDEMHEIRAGIADLNTKMAELSGYIKGRMK